MTLGKYSCVLAITLAFSPALFAEVLVKATAVDGQTIEAIPGQVIVRYKQGRQTRGRASAQTLGATQKSTPLEKLGIDVLRLPDGESIDSFIDKIKNDPDIEFAEPNGVMRALLTPNDPLFSSQYSLQANRLNMEAAWDITMGSPTVIVAVVDSGISYSNPDISTGTKGYQFGLDWNNDSLCTSPAHPIFGEEQCPSPTPVDHGSFHGTAVAGIISAQNNNNTLISGIAPHCLIMPLKVLNSDGNGTFEAIASAIIYAVDNGAAVINMSLGSYADSATMRTATQYASGHNIVLVAASGNDGAPVVYPAAHDNVIAVGAVAADDQIAHISNYGPQIDLVAPGIGILVLSETATSTLDGTSFAAPMVSGVVALMLSINPGLSVNEVKRYLTFYADDLGSPGFDHYYGFGRLNAFRSLQAVQNRSTFVSSASNGNKTFPTPNPFNPTLGLQVQFNAPVSLGTNNIKVTVMNLSGQTVKELSYPDGAITLSWDGRNDDGRLIASGLYYYRLETNKGHSIGKLTVIK